MHVGMNRTFIYFVLWIWRVPHARGDEPKQDLKVIVVMMSSPCTWG